MSLGLSKRFQEPETEALFDGAKMACEKWNVTLEEGDKTASLTGLAVSITCIGEANDDDIIPQDGAKETNLLCVSGDLGAAYMGLMLLEREKKVYYEQLKEGKINKDEAWQPDFAGKEYLIQRQMEPEARGDILKKLREAGIRPTSMVALSSSLSSAIINICKASNTGCRLFEKFIPIDYQTAVMAEELNMNLTTCAVNGGDDQELLFTCPIGDNETLQEMEGIKVIGHITKPELGVQLVARDGNEFEIKKLNN
jgi:thiamine-monophosphate kinase